jgi:hypothetical protein
MKKLFLIVACSVILTGCFPVATIPLDGKALNNDQATVTCTMMV